MENQVDDDRRNARRHPAGLLGNALAFSAFAYVVSDRPALMAAGVAGAVAMVAWFVVEMRSRRR